jgi:hypothetical protein
MAIHRHKTSVSYHRANLLTTLEIGYIVGTEGKDAARKGGAERIAVDKSQDTIPEKNKVIQERMTALTMARLVR